MAFRQIKAPALGTGSVIVGKLDSTAVSGQTGAGSVASLDTFLLHNASDSALRKVTAADLIGSYNTDDLAEGTNLYFTDARASVAVAQDIADAVSAEAVIARAAELANANAISAEETRATAAEGVNAAAITTETSRATAAESAITTAYEAADLALQASINNIIANVDPASLDSLSEIVTAFQSADDVFTAAVAANATAISDETTRATAAEGVNTTAIATEVSRAQGVEATLTSADATESAARIAGDNALDVRLTTEEGNVDTLQADLVTEASRATAAESVLTSDLASEVLRATASELANAQSIANEANARANADTSIRTDFAAADVAVTTAMETYADTAEADAIATASADATAKADSAEADAIASAEAKDVARAVTSDAADAALASRSTTLESEMDSAEGRLDILEAGGGTDPLDTISQTFSGGINELHTDTNAVEVRVTTAEADIVTNASAIANIISNTDAAALDSLTEIVSAYQTADDVHTATLNANATDRAAIRTEFANADAAIQTALTAEIGTTDAEITALQSADAAEVTNRVAGDAATLASAALDATSKADAAEAAAALDATSKADSAEADAIASAEAKDVVRAATASADATTKADAALVDAKAYTDVEVTAEEVARIAADDALQLQVTANDGDIATNVTDIAANASAISQEVADRGVAVAAVQSAIDAEISATNTDITTLTNDLSAEASRAAAAELANATAISNEVTRSSGIDATHTAGIAANVSDIATNQAAITTEVTRATAAEVALAGRTTTLESEMDSAEGRLDTVEAGLASEISTTNGEVTSLDTRVTTNEASIASILSNTDAAALDSLTEIVAAFQTADGDINNAITTLASNTATDRAAVRTEFAAADAAVTTAMETYADTAEADAIATASADATSKVAAEAVIRLANDNALDARLTTEEGNVDALEATMGTATLTTTAQNVTAAINELNSGSAVAVADLQAEVDATQVALGLAADGSFVAHTGTNFIDAATTSKGARVLLDTALKAEEVARIDGDATTAANAASDATTKANAAQAAAIASAEAKDVVRAATAAAYTDAEQTRATAAELALQGNIDSEATTARAAELANANAISAEQTRATTAEGVLTTNVAANLTEITATQAGAGLSTDGTYAASGTANYVSTASSLKDADVKLDAALKVEELARIAGDNTLTTALGVEQAARVAADGVLTANLATEVSRATAAEGVNAASIVAVSNDLATEVSRATAAEGVNTTSITNLTATVNSIISNTDAAALDSLTEIVAAFQDADTDLTTLVTGNATAITAEEVRAIAAEGVLSTALAAEVAANDTDHSAATTDRTAIRSEFATADTTLQSNIDTKLALAGGAMSGAIAMGSNKVTGLANGTADSDAINLGQLNAALTAQDMSVYTTDDLAEGSSLYFTDARARAAISVVDTAGNGLAAYDAATGVITIDTNESVLDLTDVSDTDYTGKADHVLRVNAAEDGMELVNPLNIFVTNSRQTINGDGVATQYSLTISASQSHAMVFVGGVIQDPGTHYTINDSAATLTFTSALPVGTQAVVVSPEAGLVPTLQDDSVTFEKLATNIKAFVQKGAVTASTSGTVVDTFSGANYRSAKYVIQVDGGNGEYETREALVVHDGAVAYITEYALVYTGSSLIGDASVQMNGNDVELVYTTSSADATVKVISTYIDV